MKFFSPNKGQDKWKKLFSYLTKQGFSVERLPETAVAEVSRGKHTWFFIQDCPPGIPHTLGLLFRDRDQTKRVVTGIHGSSTFVFSDSYDPAPHQFYRRFFVYVDRKKNCQILAEKTAWQRVAAPRNSLADGMTVQSQLGDVTGELYKELFPHAEKVLTLFPHARFLSVSFSIKPNTRQWQFEGCNLDLSRHIQAPWFYNTGKRVSSIQAFAEHLFSR